MVADNIINGHNFYSAGSTHTVLNGYHSSVEKYGPEKEIWESPSHWTTFLNNDFALESSRSIRKQLCLSSTPVSPMHSQQWEHRWADMAGGITHRKVDVVGCSLPGRVARMRSSLQVQGFQTKLIIFLTWLMFKSVTCSKFKKEKLLINEKYNRFFWKALAPDSVILLVIMDKGEPQYPGKMQGCWSLLLCTTCDESWGAGRCHGEASYHSHCQSCWGRIQAIFENLGLEQSQSVILLLRVICPRTRGSQLKTLAAPSSW